MIENRTEPSKSMESAVRALEQAKARLAEEKKKESAAKRKAENQHKYMMGGIVHKYFPDCYQFDENELNFILSAGIKTHEFRNAVDTIKRNNGLPSEEIVSQAKGGGENGAN